MTCSQRKNFICQVNQRDGGVFPLKTDSRRSFLALVALCQTSSCTTAFSVLPFQHHQHSLDILRASAREVNNNDENDASFMTTEKIAQLETNGIIEDPSCETTNQQEAPWLQSMKRCATKNKYRRRRKPAFPKEAYSNLLSEEENLRHNFVSFIDQSITTSYSQSVRLVEPRAYARSDQFRPENAQVPPRIEDVAEPPTQYGPLALVFAWNGIPARTVIALTAYSVFPLIVKSLVATTVDLEALATLVSDFLPGLAIVLGTYFSLTITILYDRFAKLQEVINQEASILALTCRSLMDSFERDEDTRIDAIQAVADQVRTMVFDSRGKETMGIVYNDPYARLLSLSSSAGKGSVDAGLRASIENLITLRSRRMTYESMALAPTHFDVMTFLCGMLLSGFSLGTVAVAQKDGVPTELAKILFASLVVCYTLFYEMSFDLNRPFDGIYQIRRSGAAMHFLQIKHWIANDVVLSQAVDFEEVRERGTSSTTPECDEDCQKQKLKTWYN